MENYNEVMDLYRKAMVSYARHIVGRITGEDARIHGEDAQRRIFYTAKGRYKGLRSAVMALGLVESVRDSQFSVYYVCEALVTEALCKRTEMAAKDILLRCREDIGLY